mgnify:CR=1 FL=1
MATFTFELVSPERVLFSGPVEQVVVPGEDGDMTIMAHHAPVLTTLRPGIVAVSETRSSVRRLYVRGGFADVTAAGLTLLAEQAIPAEEVSADRLAQEIRDAEDDLRDARTDDLRRKATDRIAGLKTMQTALRG